MRSLGQFVGHLTSAVKSDPAKAEPTDTNPTKAGGEKREVRREVEEREETGPDGRKVTLRRTTVEEIEIQPSAEPSKTPGQTSTKSSAKTTDGDAARE